MAPVEVVVVDKEEARHQVRDTPITSHVIIQVTHS